MIKRYWKGLTSLLKYHWHVLFYPDPLFNALRDLTNYVQIILVIFAFGLAWLWDNCKQNKDERERDAAILTAYKMELSNNVVMIQMNLNIIRQPSTSTNAHSIGPFFQYRNTGLDLIRQRIPNQFLKKPTTLDTISRLYTLTDHANEQLRIRNAARLASAALSGVESELILFEQKIVAEQNNLLDITTNALIVIGKL